MKVAGLPAPFGYADILPSGSTRLRQPTLTATTGKLGPKVPGSVAHEGQSVARRPLSRMRRSGLPLGALSFGSIVSWATVPELWCRRRVRGPIGLPPHCDPQAAEALLALGRRLPRPWPWAVVWTRYALGTARVLAARSPGGLTSARGAIRSTQLAPNSIGPLR